MDRNAFRQINLGTAEKVSIVVDWMRYVRTLGTPVPRDRETEASFILQSEEPIIMELRDADPWLQEHVARLFWTCVDLGLLKYHYPYPHNGQSYTPTRLGRLVGAMPKLVAVVILRGMLAFEAIAGPVKSFKKIRNMVALTTALVSWFSNPQIQATTLAVISTVAAVLSTWVAEFLVTANE
ncbi:hypothetical protein AB4Z32_26340 [Massilia sp. 2TAF26]|uniref:hypothetical protein n=1 Tax=Massilia sp. 2TAF26 TaxID=3233012 RepID=UPI003F954A97